jgi:hypothetical protein
MKNKGFTLTEVIIACGVLTLFLGGLLSLYSSGSKMGNSTMWLQSTTSQLKAAARQINSSIRKSSYPTLLTFPKTITENKEDCFKLKYYDGKLEASTCPSPNNAEYGKIFLIATESTPGKTGFSSTENQDAQMVYHVFSLANTGDMTYSKYQDSESASTFTSNFTKAIPGTATGIYKTVLVRNVEYIQCSRKDEKNRTTETEPQPIQILINCVMPRSSTSRQEVAVGTPNVDIFAIK